jgi:hypothetical protein
MSLRTILIVEADHAAALSIVFTDGMGFSQDMTQARRLCALGPATPSTAATHYLADAAIMEVDMEDKMRRMAAGDYMPQVVWGEIEGITEAEAVAAAGALTVISEAGPLGGIGDLPSLLAAKGLQFVPDPEI